MGTFLIITFLFASKAAFLLWFFDTVQGYYHIWRDSGTPFEYPFAWREAIYNACISAAGWAWVFGSGIA